MLNYNKHTESYYAATARAMAQYPILDGDYNADICVIGGGLTGINTAIELAERGFSVVVLEARRIGWGASGRNGGQLLRGIGYDVTGLARHVGQEGVRFIEEAGLECVKIVSERIEKYGIECDLRWGNCELANTLAHYESFFEKQAKLASYGYKPEVRVVSPDSMHEVVGSDRYAGGMIDMGSGHLHPLDLILGEARAAAQLGVKIFEQSPVIRIKHGPIVTVDTPRGRVHAKTLVLGCNAYLNDLEPKLSGKVLPAGSYIIATEPLPQDLAETLIPQNMCLFDLKFELDYYRLSADRRLLFGGACHYSGRDPKDIGAYMRPKMLKVFPQLENVAIDYQWGGMIGVTSNRFPQVGRLKEHPNVFYAQGYSGHGLNVTHLTARILAESIADGESKGMDIFSAVPHMTFPGGKIMRSPLLALGMLWYRLREGFH